MPKPRGACAVSCRMRRAAGGMAAADEAAGTDERDDDDADGGVENEDGAPIRIAMACVWCAAERSSIGTSSRCIMSALCVEN